jgi:hypothetical protein
MTGNLSRRALGTFAAGLAVAATIGGVGYAVTAQPRADAGAGPAVPTRFVAVTRGTVTERVQLGGTLGFDGSYPVVNQFAPGVLTAAAEPGATVSRGGSLYAVDNRSVRLLYGTTPAYRAFTAGMPDGPDVAELEADLVALGFDPFHDITVDSRFTWATVAAIRRWQAAWGWPVWQRTGQLDAGEVVFLPGPVRVAQVQATVGARVAPDAPVLATTSTNRVVTAHVTTDRQALVHLGDQVLVTLPSVAPIPGTVTRIGRVASAPTGSGGPGGSGGGGSGGPPTGPVTIPVTIAIQPPPGAADLDQAPVQVAVTSARHTGVLLVPVTALLARPGGGYQVRLADRTFVEVQPGLFDDSSGQVEVAGTGLGEGQQVEVPAS